MITELVHCRFPNLNHNTPQEHYKYDTLIDEILKGKTFEEKHTHLFAGYYKRDIYLINGSTPEEIVKYLTTQKKRDASREEYNQKCRMYWDLYNQIDAKIKTQP